MEKYQASHIKMSLDAAAINTRKKKPTKKSETGKRPESED
jgi:hypothetical protein